MSINETNVGQVDEGSAIRKSLRERSLQDFQKVFPAAHEATEIHSFRVGPLEAFDGAEDRLIQRYGRVMAMLTVMAGDADAPFEWFDKINVMMRFDYVQAIEDLVSSMYVDAEVAIADAAEKRKTAAA